MKEEDQSYQISFSKLLPKNLLKIGVKIDNSTCTALLDTGAMNSLVKESLALKLKLKTVKKTARLAGLGMNVFESQARAYWKIEFAGMLAKKSHF